METTAPRVGGFIFRMEREKLGPYVGPNNNRVYVPGDTIYLIDDEPVSREEFERRAREANFVSIED